MMKTTNYLLTESVVSTISVYLILRKLMTEFEQWDAYKLGIIDKNGNKIKHPVTSKERESWDMLTRLCCNIKKISTKFIGKSKFASYFTAAYLLKDSISMFYIEKNLDQLNESSLTKFSYHKQNHIYNILKSLPQINEKITDDNIELYMFKVLQIVEDVVESSNTKTYLFEDEGVVVSGDVAKADSVIGDKNQPSQKLNVKLFRRKKRKKHESN